MVRTSGAKPSSSTSTVAQDSGEDSDAYVMRVYNQMIEKEKSKNENPKNGRKKGSINNNRGKTKNSNSTNATKDEELEEYNESINGDKSITELKEENERLKTLVDQLKNESQKVINKASNLKQKDKTSVMQIIELLKFNAYLVSHLPNADQILEEYLTKPQTNDLKTLNTSKGSNQIKSSPSKGPKSSVNVNSISNYFKSVDRSESNGSNVRKNSSSNSDSDDKPLAEKYSSKEDSSDNFTKLKSKQISKRSKRVNQRYDDLSDNEKSSKEAKIDKRRKKTPETPKRVSPRKVNQKRYVSESAAEGSSDEKNESMASVPNKHLKRSESKTRESVDKNSAEKRVNKRRRKRREEEPKGHFPCTFDPKQCDEIMDTKENFDFHMSGHYDAKYVCPFCAYTGPTIQIIRRHLNKERETAIQEAEEGKKLNEDKRAHKEVKIYQCFGCKVCHKIHGKLEERCKCIDEDSDNECTFKHDMDYEFKDHLKSRHFTEIFRSVKDSDERKQKIRSVADKFVDELYFENKAKKVHLMEELIESVLKEPKNKSDDNTKDDNKRDDNKKVDNKKIRKKTETVRPELSDSDSDWD